MYQVKQYLRAESPEQAYEALCESPDNGLIGGGLWMRMGRKAYGTLIDLSLLGLDRITEKDGFIEIGAMVSFRELETSPLIKGCFSGVLSKAVAPVVGTQFRRMATVGGTVWGKYAFSDLIPVLLALGAQVVLYQGGVMSLEDFLAAKATRDILLAVRVPADDGKASCQALRTSAADFAVLNVCVALCEAEWRVVVGNRPGVAMRCPEAEEALREGRVQDACAAVAGLSYSSNLRASAEYRRAMAPVLLERALRQLKEAEL